MLAGALLLDAQQAPSNSAGIYVPASGWYAVGAVDDLVLHGGTRNKDLHIKIFYPEAAGPPGDKYQVFIQGASHMTFTGLPAEMGRQPEALFGIARIASVAFWDAYLKESKNAKTYLPSDALETYSRGAARLKRK